MITVGEAVELLKAGFTMDDIKSMESWQAEQEHKKKEQEQPPEQKKEQKDEENAFDVRLNKLTGLVENLVETVGKLPFSFSMGMNEEQNVDNILASIINPPKKGD